MTLVKVPSKWDYETDVIVIGAGNAGLPAAIAAAEAGAKVTVLELMSYSASSLALINVGPAFAGADEQKEMGIEDSPEDFYKDGVELAKGDPGIWRVFMDHHREVYDWCKKIGMQFEAPPFGGRTLRANGVEMLRCLEREAKNKNVDIRYLHRATRLIIDCDTNRVLGVQVRVKDKEQYFKANKAVVITTGGFGRNKDMVAEFGPEYVNCIPTMPPGHLGDGLKMGLAIGAGTRNLGAAVIPSFPVDANTKGWGDIPNGAIHVNVNGKRYTNESDPKRFYGLVSKDGMKQPGGVWWAVFDAELKKLPPHFKYVKANTKPEVADSLDELAKKTGIDAKGLKETVDKYNGDIDSVGYDTVLGRQPAPLPGAKMAKIATAPFYAIKCAASTSSFKGGLKINKECHVLDQYDEIIPNLYAAGEVTGGLWGADGTYFGGTMVSSGITFGRIAGQNAAAEKSW